MAAARPRPARRGGAATGVYQRTGGDSRARRWAAGPGLRTMARPAAASHPPDGVIHDEDDDRPDDRHQAAIEVQAGHPRVAEGVEQPAADDGADDAEDDVEEDALPRLVD